LQSDRAACVMGIDSVVKIALRLRARGALTGPR
jgi:hypothetical protein